MWKISLYQPATRLIESIECATNFHQLEFVTISILFGIDAAIALIIKSWEAFLLKLLKLYSKQNAVRNIGDIIMLLTTKKLNIST